MHETRKALKRLRALMRLLAGELGAKRAAREHAVLRDAAARLAGARDAEVMVETLDALLRRHPRKLGGRRGLAELREQLERERRAATTQALGDAAARGEVALQLSDLRARVVRWQLADRAADRLARDGLEHIYRAGRKGHRRAAAASPAGGRPHRWRKHVKDMRYAPEALDVQDRPARPGRADGQARGTR